MYTNVYIYKSYVRRTRDLKWCSLLSSLCLSFSLSLQICSRAWCFVFLLRFLSLFFYFSLSLSNLRDLKSQGLQVKIWS